MKIATKQKLIKILNKLGDNSKDTVVVKDILKKIEETKGLIPDVPEIPSLQPVIEKIENIEGNIENLTETLAEIFDTVYSQEDLDEITTEIEKLNVLVRSFRGGGNMNRRILVDGANPLTRYTDINLKAGSNVTITTTDDNTAKQVDITFASSGGGGTPGGSDTQVQFNDGGSFGGDSAFTWDKTFNLLNVNSGGKINVGTPDTMVLHGTNIISQFQANADSYVSYEAHGHSDDASQGGFFYGAKSRGSTASPTIVGSGDIVQATIGLGYDGTDMEYVGYTAFEVDGTPGNNDMPGRYVIYTTADGAFTPTERLRIANTGAWGIAGANFGTSGNLLVSGGSGSPPAWTGLSSIDHNSLANLTVGDVHTQYALLAGRSGGQTLIGGTASGDDLELESTSNATKGHIRSRSNFIIGNGVAGVDYTLTFDGETNDTSLTWMEDEDYLLFADDITMNVGRKIFLDYAATTYLSSPSTSVTQFVVSGTPFFNLNASTEFQYFGAYTLGTTFSFWTNTLGFPGSSWFIGSNTYGATYRTVVNVANITSSTGDIMNFLTGASAVNTGSIQSVINSIGQFGIKRTTATAHLHLGAGTTSASTAPLKFTSGTSMTSAEAGAVEYTTDDLFFTISTGTARKRILFADPTGGLTSGRVPVATTNGRLTDDADLTFATDTLTATHYRANATITFDEEVDNGNSSTADTIDWTAGNVQKSTLTGNVTYTFTAPSAPGLFSLKMIQDGTGGRTATWPSAVKWQRGINPFNGTQAASEIDVAYFRYDGTNYQAWATYDHK